MLTNLTSILAYLDPGTGSIILQVIAAAVLSVGLVFRQAFAVLMSPFVRLFRRSNREPNRE